MARAGAAFVDVGAMSTAPYLAGRISEDEEADRLGSAVGLLAGKIEVPISADTSRSGPARAALEAGARIINDVTGLTGDADLAGVVAAGGSRPHRDGLRRRLRRRRPAGPAAMGPRHRAP